MRRREFIGLLGGAATAFPFAARSQGTTNRLRRIGALVGTSPYPKVYTAFEQGLQDRGWRIGENILIEYRFAEGHLERLPALAAELVDHKVELIFAVTAPETRAAKAATRTIPIVFAAHGDPVDSGDVLRFAHPFLASRAILIKPARVVHDPDLAGPGVWHQNSTDRLAINGIFGWTAAAIPAGSEENRRNHERRREAP